LKGRGDSTTLRSVGILDKSIVRPVLDALNTLRSSRQDLAVYYLIIDRFCALWMGRPREEMDLEDDEATYLAHDLLREYLRFEGNDRRVALWLLTINRCCGNAGADLTGVTSEFDRAVMSTDLDFDHTLLSPILERVRLFEERHARAAEEGLGERDPLGSFLQWVGVYSSYVYPRLLQDARASDRSMVSTLAFLISEFISLKENVGRMATLLLAIKETCALARPEANPSGGEHAGVVDTWVKPGTEAGYVQQILERLGAESAGISRAAPDGGPGPAPAADGDGAPKAARAGEAPNAPQTGRTGVEHEIQRVLAAVGELEHTGAEGVGAALARLQSWAGREAARDGEDLRAAVDELCGRESGRSRAAVRRMSAGLSADPGRVLSALERRLRPARGSGRALLARLAVLAVLDAAAPPRPGGDGLPATGEGLMAALRSLRSRSPSA
jgi:hypothetical protein